MNISGILVQTRPENVLNVVEQIKNNECCEYHLHDEKGRIVVIIEGENTEEEINKLKFLKTFKHVIAADMMYAYSEDELEQIRGELDANNDLPKWLNDPNAKIEDIKYNGDLTKKML